MASPGQPTSYRPEYGELAYNYCLLGATNGGAAGCRRGEHAACRRVSSIWQSLAETAETGFRRFRRSGHCASIRAIFTYSVHLARLCPLADGPWAFRRRRARPDRDGALRTVGLGEADKRIVPTGDTWLA
jgi:hypothetical protein